MARRKPRSPGVMLRNRAADCYRYDDEMRADGGKAKLHRKVRRMERNQLHRDLRNDNV